LRTKKFIWLFVILMITLLDLACTRDFVKNKYFINTHGERLKFSKSNRFEFYSREYTKELLSNGTYIR
jgi:hypothetical protein